MRVTRTVLLVFCTLMIGTPVFAQSMSLAEVEATGARYMTAVEVKALVSGAKTELTLVSGATRIWTNEADGTFVASRTNGPKIRRTATGTWSVNDDAAYCLNFDWGSMETENSCRRLYKVEDRYYAYGLGAKPDTMSGRYRFAR
jgi:Protein of unknown function (DUF995)